MKIKPPFTVSFDGPYQYCVWGLSFCVVRGQARFGYNARGSWAQLPFGVNWDKKGVHLEGRAV